jgi:hypothetical protein
MASLESGFRNISVVTQAETRYATQLLIKQEERYGYTWSQDSGTSPPLAKQRPGMRLITGRMGGEVWLHGVRIQEHLRCQLSAKQRPGMLLNYWSNRRRGAAT